MDNNILKDFGDNPTDIFQNWISEAEKTEPSDPNAMALATVGADGRPSVRMVLLKEFDETGFTFFTNTDSSKGRALEHHPFAELNFYWKSTQKQIRIAGSVEKITAKESDAYFSTRPRESQIGAWASNQSKPAHSYEEFELKVAEFTKKFEGKNVPRPTHWNGYRLKPSKMEFWMAHPHRLHKRVLFELKNNRWNATWLYP